MPSQPALHSTVERLDSLLLTVGDSKVPRIAGCSQNLCPTLYALFQLVQNASFLVYDLAGQGVTICKGLADAGGSRYLEISLLLQRSLENVDN